MLSVQGLKGKPEPGERPWRSLPDVPMKIDRSETTNIRYEETDK